MINTTGFPAGLEHISCGVLAEAIGREAVLHVANVGAGGRVVSLVNAHRVGMVVVLVPTVGVTMAGINSLPLIVVGHGAIVSRPEIRRIETKPFLLEMIRNHTVTKRGKGDPP